MNSLGWAGKDKDRYYGPITVSVDSDYLQWGAVATSSNDDGRPPNLRVHMHNLTVLIRLPGWTIRPHKEKVKFRHISNADRDRLGRDWYWQIDKRAFGVTVSGGVVHMAFGRQTHDSDTDRSKCYFLPWQQWRHVRHSFYDMDGDLFCDVSNDWGQRKMQETACPSVSFEFTDFDGEAITAKTRVEERQWKRGEGRFKWLSAIVQDLVVRSLTLEFSSEVGSRKRSWKGGSIGHSIEMMAGETHEDAFRRYCDLENLKFVAVSDKKTARDR